MEHAWENHHASNRPGGDHSAGLWQRTGGPAHPDDTPMQRSASTGMRDWQFLVAGCCDEEAQREEQSSPTFDLQ